MNINITMNLPASPASPAPAPFGNLVATLPASAAQINEISHAFTICLPTKLDGSRYLRPEIFFECIQKRVSESNLIYIFNHFDILTSWHLDILTSWHLDILWCLASVRCQDVKMSKCRHDILTSVRCQDVKMSNWHINFPIHKMSRCQDVKMHLVHF